jgi:hypothetical protein
MTNITNEQLEAWAGLGPWEAGRPDMATIVDGVSSKWIYAGDTYVAVASGRASEDWDVIMNNARLIAAAPALAAALLAERKAREVEPPEWFTTDEDCGFNAALAEIKRRAGIVEGEG